MLGFQWPTPDAHDALAEQMLDRIPPQASVSAANSLVPRLANRPYIYTFPKNEDAEYIAIDTQSSYYPFGDREELCGEVRQLVVEAGYGVIYFADGLLLFQRGVPDQVEVAQTLWAPLEPMARGELSDSFRVDRPGLENVDMPCFRVHGKTVWGLTFMMLASLLGLLR